MARCWVIIYFTAIFFSDEYSSPVLCFFIPLMAVAALSWILSAKSSLKVMMLSWSNCSQEANGKAIVGWVLHEQNFVLIQGFTWESVSYLPASRGRQKAFNISQRHHLPCLRDSLFGFISQLLKIKPAAGKLCVVWEAILLLQRLVLHLKVGLSKLMKHLPAGPKLCSHGTGHFLPQAACLVSAASGSHSPVLWLSRPWGLDILVFPLLLIANSQKAEEMPT